MPRRMLINFRIRPQALQPLLPPPFRPKTIDGWGIAGICLIRLERTRPPFLPAVLGLSSENAAHRIAVEWTDAGVTHEGVFIPRRDSDSTMNQIVGGRLFPGTHGQATVLVYETEQQYKIEFRDNTRRILVRVAARRAEAWPAGSLFSSLRHAAEFFRSGVNGWSPGTNGSFDGVQLQANDWNLAPLIVDHLECPYFQDPARFPAGTAEFDSALLMRGIPHVWKALNPTHLPATRSIRRHGPSSLFEMP